MYKNIKLNQSSSDLDHRQFEKKAVNCNLIDPDAGAGIILLSVRGGGCSVVEYYVEVVVP